MDLPLDTPITFHALTLVIRYINEKGNIFYPQMFLEDCLYDNV